MTSHVFGWTHARTAPGIRDAVRSELVRLAEELARFRYRYACEDELHQGLISALARLGRSFGHEVALGPAGRIDFTVTAPHMIADFSALRPFARLDPATADRPVMDSVPTRPVQLGLEVKTKGAPTEIAAQLIRYAERDEIDGLLLVTAKTSHRHAFPVDLLGKPLHLLIVGPFA